MICSKILVGLVALSAASSGSAYKLPAAWPSVDQTVLLNGAFLQDPLVTDAMSHVKDVVPASILSIPPSTFISGNTVTYNADPVANCYWPNGLCLRNSDTANWKSDVSKCPGDNTWGLTYDDGPSVNLLNGVHVNDTAAV